MFPRPGILRAGTLEWLPFPSPMSASEVSQSCPTLSDPMDLSLPGSSVHGIFRQEYWSGVPLPSPVLVYATAAAKSLQSCPNLCDPIDGSPPGSTVLGILQARILEWVAISFSIIYFEGI